jgi:hypothetical protein
MCVKEEKENTKKTQTNTFRFPLSLIEELKKESFSNFASMAMLQVPF